jgi:hypothetical protein
MKTEVIAEISIVIVLQRIIIQHYDVSGFLV